VLYPSAPVSASSAQFNDWLTSLTDAQVMGVTLLGEARGEDTLGRQMVASVFMTRVKISQAHQARVGAPYWWGMNVREVILMPWQFSCWNESDPNRPKLMSLPEEPLWPEAMFIAESALTGTLPDQANGATHYLNPLTARPLPTWAISANQVAEHLHHTFYRVV
jgi:spore germination cell wall hydrolase CwlJ-like protein